MLTNNKALFALALTSILVLVLVLIQRHIVNQVELALNESNQQKILLENYILSTFNANEMEGKADVSDICFPYLDESNIVIFLPSDLCHACFSSLIFYFQDINLPGDRVTVICEHKDIQVEIECRARNMNYMPAPQTVGHISDIIVFRLYKGVIPIALSYKVGRDFLLPLFLSDDERLLQALSVNN